MHKKVYWNPFPINFFFDVNFQPSVLFSNYSIHSVGMAMALFSIFSFKTVAVFCCGIVVFLCDGLWAFPFLTYLRRLYIFEFSNSFKI